MVQTPDASTMTRFACPTARVPSARWLLVTLLIALPLLALAQVQESRPHFQVERASTRLVDEVFRLDARVDLEFSGEVLEALNSGVPLTVVFEIEIVRRGAIWDRTVAELSQRHEIAYRALSDSYLLTNLSTFQRQSFPNRRAAISALGMIQDCPMLDRRLLEVGETYAARLRARLEIESLPLPLRPVAYLVSAWDLGSEWYEWLLEP